jgi:hypothetical protein
MVVEVV